jgi:hypothetical protein
MAQKLKKEKHRSKAKQLHIAALLLVAALAGVGGYCVYAKSTYYKQVADQASITQVRELIILAVRGLKKDAPVDYKTGDVYFPESRLFLPNPGLPLTITYLYDKGDVTNSQSELSVSTYPVRGTETLYTARNNDELFAAVPKLQACSRGIKIVHQHFSRDDTQNELKHTVRLSSGKDVFVYLEKECPELSETADLFKNLRAY